MEELIIAFMSNDTEPDYVFNRSTMEIILDAEFLTDEPEIDWDDEEMTEHLILIPKLSSHEAFEVMVQFAKEQDSEIRSQLLNILEGRKPFRNFKDKVFTLGVQDSWYRFENDYVTNEVTQWLKENDIVLDK